MQEVSTTIRQVSDQDVPRLFAVLAAAFHDDPLNSWLAPDPGRRAATLASGMALELGAIYLPLGGCYTTADLSGAALWAPPGHWKLPAARQLRLLPSLARLFGLRRLPAVLSGLSTLERHHPDAPHWYLAILGVAPDRQGQGLGSALLAHVLARCDADNVGAYLETSNRRNLPLYRRHGFEVREELDISGGPHLWTMWRDPA
jgi:ribosomal protein S18 acetylase RimI-like enzyme